MTTKEILIAARAKIEKPNLWVQGTYARNHRGEGVLGDDPDALCWCSIGAVRAITGHDEEGLGDGALDFLQEIMRTNYHARDIAQFNDAPNRTHAEVLAAFDKAIASLP